MILCYKITQLFAAVLIRVIVVEVVDETKADEELPARKLGQDQKMEAEVHHRPCMTNPQTSIFVIRHLQNSSQAFALICFCDQLATDFARINYQASTDI